MGLLTQVLGSLCLRFKLLGPSQKIYDIWVLGPPWAPGYYPLRHPKYHLTNRDHEARSGATLGSRGCDRACSGLPSRGALPGPAHGRELRNGPVFSRLRKPFLRLTGPLLAKGPKYVNNDYHGSNSVYINAASTSYFWGSGM